MENTENANILLNEVFTQMDVFYIIYLMKIRINTITFEV